MRSRGQRGQGMVEGALVAALFVGIVLGVLTAGHAFLAINMITHAARDGARLAATWPTRGACNKIDNTNAAAIATKVQNEITSVVPLTFNLAVDIQNDPAQSGTLPCAASPTPMVKVTVTGCVQYLIPFIPTHLIFGQSGWTNLGIQCSGQQGFSINRVVEFHDESF